MPCKICGFEQSHSTKCPLFTGVEMVRFDDDEKGDVKKMVYRGSEYEADLLGSVEIGPKYIARVKELGGRWDGEKGSFYLPFKEALQVSKEFQPWKDPENPEKDFLREMFIEVQERLQNQKDLSDVRAYTTGGEGDGVKSSFDVFHGGDAVITAMHNGKEVVALIDTSLRPEKVEYAQSHGGYTEKDAVLISNTTSVEDDEDAYLAEIEEYAKLIENILVDKINGVDRKNTVHRSDTQTYRDESFFND